MRRRTYENVSGVDEISISLCGINKKYYESFCKGCENVKEPDILYHYCSLETFFNIIKNHTLWLSDVSKSNDSMELRHFIDCMKFIFIKKRKILLEEEIELAKKGIFLGGESISSKIDQVLNLFFEKSLFLKAWGICFSEEGDLLSQWRGYADDAKGISIGFSKKYLDVVCKDIDRNEVLQIKLDKVSYDEEMINKIIRDKTSFNSINNKSTFDEVDRIINRVLLLCSAESPFYKKSSFSEEKEWRLAITDFLPSDIEKNKYLDVLKSTNPDIYPLEISDMNYVVKNKTLVSYIEVYLNNIKDAVSKIIIGPKSKSTVEDIKQFLVFYGLLENELDSSIEVRKSDISYR